MPIPPPRNKPKHFKTPANPREALEKSEGTPPASPAALSAPGGAAATKKPSPPKQGKKPGAASLHKADHDPRAAALVALTRVLFEGVDSQAAVDDALRSPRLVPTDKRLCTELTYGVLRCYLRLEWFVRRFLAKPDKLPGEMFLSLLMALYELNFLRIPPHATLDWTVGHVRNRFGQGLARVANGALRSMQRSLVDFYKPGLYGKSFAVEEERLACLHALPVWLVRLWREQYGEEEAALLLRSSEQPAPSGLRLNPQRSGWEEARDDLLRAEGSATRRGGKGGRGKTAPTTSGKPLRATETPGIALPHAGVPGPGLTRPDALGSGVPGVPDIPGTPEQHAPGIPVADTPELFVLPVGETALAFTGTLPWQGKTLVKEGRATRQSAASYEALTAFDPARWPGPVWDCCAGRGGKTLALLEMGVPVTLATDPSEARLAALPQEYRRLGITNPPCPACAVASAVEAFASPEGAASPSQPATPADAGKDTAEGTGPPRLFGTVLVDAPCSGLGTLSRRPEIRLRRTIQDIEGLIGVQRAILAAAWQRLLPGGLLIYLTCTRNTGENQEQIAAFVREHPGAILEQEFQTPADSPLREFFYGAKVRKEK